MQGAFIFETASFRTAHAATLAETPDGFVAAWFGGTREGHSDVGIWCARHDAAGWSAPQQVASGADSGGRVCPCWNPVLFQVPAGPLLLFYKVGSSPSRWWGMHMRSEDGGRTWMLPQRLPAGILGPIKNKPVLLAGGLLLCPSSSENAGWRAHIEYTADFGATWRRGEPLNNGREFAAIQPAILSHGSGHLQLLCRTRQGLIAECWSEDGGLSWSPMGATALPNPDSGIDAVTLADGRSLLVYNHAYAQRTPLNVSITEDGRRWYALCALEEDGGEYSYPAVIQGADGRVHIAYTWNRRRIRHAVLDVNEFGPAAIRDGTWPL